MRPSGEVVGGYAPLLEEASGALNLWVADYCADHFGYLPTARVVKQGGYEARDFITGFGYLDWTAEGAIIEKVRELAEQVGRSIGEQSGMQQ